MHSQRTQHSNTRLLSDFIDLPPTHGPTSATNLIRRQQFYSIVREGPISQANFRTSKREKLVQEVHAIRFQFNWMEFEWIASHVATENGQPLPFNANVRQTILTQVNNSSARTQATRDGFSSLNMKISFVPRETWYWRMLIASVCECFLGEYSFWFHIWWAPIRSDFLIKWAHAIQKLMRWFRHLRKTELIGIETTTRIWNRLPPVTISIRCFHPLRIDPKWMWAPVEFNCF